MYGVYVIPFELAFYELRDPKFYLKVPDILLVFDLVVAVIFPFDMLINLRTTYFNE